MKIGEGRCNKEGIDKEGKSNRRGKRGKKGELKERQKGRKRIGTEEETIEKIHKEEGRER